MVCLSGKVVTAGHPLNWSTMTRKCRPSTSPMSVWMISNGLVAGWCFFSGSAGNDGSWLTHSSHVDAALVMSTSMFGQYIDKRARCRIFEAPWCMLSNVWSVSLTKMRGRTMRGPYTNMSSQSSMANP